MGRAALAGLGAVAVLAPLAASPPSASLLTRPPATVGSAWRSTLAVRGADPATVTVRAVRGAVRRTVVARRTAPRRYRVDLVFPSAGAWTVAARLGRRWVPLGRVVVQPGEYRLSSPGNIMLSGSTLYLAEGLRGNVLAIDLPTGRTRVVASGFANPWGLALTPSGELVVTSRETLALVNVATGASRVLVRAPVGVELGPILVRGDEAYVGSSDERIRRVDLRSGTMTVIAGAGGQGNAGDGGPALDATMTDVHGLAFDADGTLLFADTGNDRVRRLDLARGIVTAVHGGLAAVGSIVFAADGSLYAGEMSAGRVTRIDRTGARTSIGGFEIPCCVQPAPDGTLYVVDSGRATLSRVARDGTVTRVRLTAPR